MKTDPGILSPCCLSPEWRVLRTMNVGCRKRREHKCAKCGKRFHTVQAIDLTLPVADISGTVLPLAERLLKALKTTPISGRDSV